MTIASQRASHPIIRETHSNHGLLFQFILSEFLETYEEVRKLAILSGHREIPIPLNVSLMLKHSQEEIHEILLKLLGSFKGGLSYFSWNFADGLLNKLHSYSILLLENSELFEKELIAMHAAIEKIRSACSLTLDFINKKANNHSELFANLLKAIQAMQLLAKVITRMVHQFKEDENVIFFILRHKAQFDRLYGNGYVFKLLLRLYPNGLDEARQFLAKKYRNRGFNNVLNLIDSLISEFVV